MSYDIKKMLEAAEQKRNQGNFKKLSYWKPDVGSHEIRFLPVDYSDHMPFLKVLYYEKIAERRFVAPTTFNMEDPIVSIFNEKRKEKDGWNVAKLFKPRERYYAIILVRGEEAKGPQVWEFSKELHDDFWNILTNADNIDEDCFSPEMGYDFTINVTATGKVYNGYPVKEIKPIIRKKPSKLCAKPADAKAILDQMPDLETYFKAQVKKPEECLELLEEFLAKLQPEAVANPAASEETTRNVSVSKEQENANKIANAFDMND